MLKKLLKLKPPLERKPCETKGKLVGKSGRYAEGSAAYETGRIKWVEPRAA